MEESRESFHHASGRYVKSTLGESQKHELTEQFHFQRFYRHLVFVVAAEISRKLALTFPKLALLCNCGSRVIETNPERLDEALLTEFCEADGPGGRAVGEKPVSEHPVE